MTPFGPRLSLTANADDSALVGKVTIVVERTDWLWRAASKADATFLARIRAHRSLGP